MTQESINGKPYMFCSFSWVYLEAFISLRPRKLELVTDPDKFGFLWRIDEKKRSFIVFFTVVSVEYLLGFFSLSISNVHLDFIFFLC